MTWLRAGACLSLSGRFGQFGRQAEQGLRLWADGCGARLNIVDDQSDPAVVREALPRLAATSHLLFGPYSTVLMRAAIDATADCGVLLFNHGGSGGALDAPGRVVNILTPAGRYAEPFVKHLVEVGGERLFTIRGKGAFGRDVIAGAETAATEAGLSVETLDLNTPPTGTWDLISAGVYEDDIANVRHALALPNPPRKVCSVAAGVATFAHDLGASPDGIYGIGQWAPGSTGPVDVGMPEAELLAAWRHRYDTSPDYPGIQAYAAGTIAEAAVRTAETTEPAGLWEVLTALDFTTAFGAFRLDPETGRQTGHEAVLTRWNGGTQQRVSD